MDGDMELSRDFREFAGSLNDHDVRYLVVGGYAVAFHGHPRYTKDLDVWIERSEINAERIVRALEAFGLGSLGLQAADFLEEDQIFQFGYPPLRIDLLTSVPGVEFDACFAARIEVPVSGIRVCFIDIESLKRAKTASGRHQDLADLENLS